MRAGSWRRRRRILMEEGNFVCGREEEMGRNIGDRSSVDNGDRLSFSSLLGWRGLSQKSFIKETWVCFLMAETVPISPWALRPSQWWNPFPYKSPVWLGSYVRFHFTFPCAILVKIRAYFHGLHPNWPSDSPQELLKCVCWGISRLLKMRGYGPSNWTFEQASQIFLTLSRIQNHWLDWKAGVQWRCLLPHDSYTMFTGPNHIWHFKNGVEWTQLDLIQHQEQTRRKGDWSSIF